MKLNSEESIKTANAVFRGYHSSWSAARDAAGGKRDSDGVLLVPEPGTADNEPQVDQQPPDRRSNAG